MKNFKVISKKMTELWSFLDLIFFHSFCIEKFEIKKKYFLKVTLKLGNVRS